MGDSQNLQPLKRKIAAGTRCLCAGCVYTVERCQTRPPCSCQTTAPVLLSSAPSTLTNSASYEASTQQLVYQCSRSPFTLHKTAKMPATGQLMNDSLMEVEHTPPVHKRILDVLPGVSGGVARIMVGQPFDTIKTRMQVLGKGTIGAQGMPADMVYTSGMDCVRKMFKSEGPMSLYKGTVAPLLGNMLLLGIHFPTFNNVRATLEQGKEPGLHHGAILAAGAAAGAAGSVVSTPTELIRTKMQMVRKNNLLAQMKGAGATLNPEENYKGNWDCAKKILRNHGMRGIYQGYVSTLLRDMQGYAWFFYGYEATIHYLAGPGKTKADLDYTQVMMAGVIAGFGLWGSMFPIDTIKSKIQAQSLSKPEFAGTMDCVRRSLAVEGYAGMWRGVTAALWRAIPVNAAIFLAVEGTRQLIEDTEDQVDALVNKVSGQAATA